MQADSLHSSGYLSNYEIGDIIDSYNYDPSTFSSFTQYQDQGDVLVYNGNWVSWLSPESYQARMSWYDSMNFGGSADWAIDLNRSYSYDGKGFEDDGDYDEWDDYVGCPGMNFSSLNDLDTAVAQGGVRSDCITIYTLQALMVMWDTTYANYTNINRGYDALFGYYVTYMMKLVPAVLEDDLMWNMSTTPANTPFPNVGDGMNCT